jgi:hypothetical protein
VMPYQVRLSEGSPAWATDAVQPAIASRRAFVYFFTSYAP